MSRDEKRGHVYLVGAGPGALGLVTLRARQLIEQADVIVYDYLCNPEMLRWARGDAEKIYVGKSGSYHTIPQEEINAILTSRALAGKEVVRLKGGDPYVFGRGGEEAQILARSGIPFEVVPGVTSAIAVPSYAGIPVTHRDFASTVTFVTGHEDPAKPDSAIDWSWLARLSGTLVFLMGVERLRQITGRLIAEGADPATPAALVRWGTTAHQETLAGTLGTIADLVQERRFSPPAAIVIGDVVKLRSELNWYEALPLFGKRIVVTRTRGQAGVLAQRLVQLGADVLEIPTIRIVPVPSDAPMREKLTAFSNHFDWLVFTSPNAVDRFFAEFFQVASDLRDLGTVKIASLGPATTAKLQQLHLRVDLQPEIFTAEKLAEALAEKIMPGARICFPKGRLAATLVADRLQERGARVESWILYDTQPEKEDLGGARLRYQNEGAHFSIFTSSSTVEYWHAMQLQSEPDTPRPRAVSLGPITSATLRRLGYEIAAEAPESTLDSLVATMLKLSMESIP
ncbi:MAG: uroporphyrinogen-III C-methyltransferase [Methylacidiphilales bacterium]|nr:uroporphyrinogen-III C-methyltransferase [Candidatus Methylacidiphilales bacterium]